MTTFLQVKRAYRDYAAKHGTKAADAIVQKASGGPVEALTNEDEYDAVLAALKEADKTATPRYGKDVKFADVHAEIHERSYARFNKTPESRNADET